MKRLSIKRCGVTLIEVLVVGAAVLAMGINAGFAGTETCGTAFSGACATSSIFIGADESLSLSLYRDKGPYTWAKGTKYQDLGKDDPFLVKVVLRNHSQKTIVLDFEVTPLASLDFVIRKNGQTVSKKGRFGDAYVIPQAGLERARISLGPGNAHVMQVSIKTMLHADAGRGLFQVIASFSHDGTEIRSAPLRLSVPRRPR
ncbi:MAG: hypothetical protein HY289_05365 [Planctomycetes bacterium]|nr:hypothetical protein [Planctomycetota bacterium]